MFKRELRERAGDPLNKVLPGRKEGLKDGQIGPDAVAARRRLFPALAGIEYDDAVRTLDAQKDYLERAKKNSIQEIDRLEREVAELNGPGPITALVVILVAFLPCGIFAEMAMVKNLAGMFNETGVIFPWIIGLVFTFTPALLMKFAFNRDEQLEVRVGARIATSVLATTSFIFAAVVAMLRSHYLVTVDAVRYRDGLQAQLFAGSTPLLAIGLFVLAFGVACVTTWIWSPISRYVRIQIRLSKISRLRAQVQKIYLSFSLIEPIKTMRASRIQNTLNVGLAEYEHGVALAGRHEPWNALKVVLFTTLLIGMGLIVGPWAYRTAASHNFTDRQALLMSAGACIMIGAGGLFLALPLLKAGHHSRVTQLILPFVALSVSMLSLSSCDSASAADRVHVAVMLDVSRSVRATNEQLIAAVANVSAHLPRCSHLSVLPVNAHAGALYEITWPCELAPFDDDIKESYKTLRAELAVEIVRWRKSDELSDYRNAFTLAAEKLASSRAPFLIVLGDLIDDPGFGRSDRTREQPSVPPLPTIGFHNAKTFIGFLDSSSLDRMSADAQAQLKKILSVNLIAAGINERDLTIRQFGLQGLNDWINSVFGSPNPTYAGTEGARK